MTEDPSSADEAPDAPDGPSETGTTAAATARTGPPNKLARNATIGVLVVLVVAANLGNIFFASFVNDRPGLLIAMNPSNRNLALTAGNMGVVAFYVIGFCRLLLPDPLFFLLGRWYGDASIRWMERTAPSYGELLRGLERWFYKARVPVVAIAPNNPVCLFAGAADMSWGLFLVANVIGTIGRLILIRAFSSVFADLLGSVRHFIADYRWPITALSIALVAFTVWNDRRAGRDGVGDLLNLEEGIAEAEAELMEEATILPGDEEGQA